MTARHRWMLALLFALASAATVGYTVHASLDPSRYFHYRARDISGWRYSAGPVAVYCALTVIDAALVLAALIARRPRALWVRGLIALLLLTPLTTFAVFSAMHAPDYVAVHICWALAMFALLLIVETVAVIARCYQWQRDRKRTRAETGTPQGPASTR